MAGFAMADPKPAERCRLPRLRHLWQLRSFGRISGKCLKQGRPLLESKENFG